MVLNSVLFRFPLWLISIMLIMLLGSSGAHPVTNRMICSPGLHPPAEVGKWPPSWECPPECNCSLLLPGALVDCVSSSKSEIPRAPAKNISLTLNYVRKILRWSFDNMTELIYLNLRSNRLNSLVSKSFKKLTKLDTLCLSGNDMKAIDPDAFVGLAQLQVLDLSENLLFYRPDFVFSSLILLKHLDLNTNSLRGSINSKAFVNASNLFTLDISSNKMSNLPFFLNSEVPNALENLRTIYSLKNNIVINSTGPGKERLPRMRGLANLTLLSLKEASIRIDFIGNSPFGGLINLKTIILNNAVIHISPNMVVDVKQKRSSRSMLGACIQRDFSVSKTNAIEALNSNFCSFCGWLVEMSDLTDNCQNAINYLINIPSVLLTYSIFKDLQNVEMLNLSGMKGLVLHSETFRNSTSIKELSLTSLNIDDTQDINALLKPLVNLRGLDMPHNHIQTVNFTFLPSILWTQLEKIDLSYNTFSCNCDIVWFLRWLNTTNVTVHEVGNTEAYTCDSPKDKKGMYILDLNIEQTAPEEAFPAATPEDKRRGLLDRNTKFCFTAPSDNLPQAVCLTEIALFFIALIISMMHKFRWHVRYWKYRMQSRKRRIRDQREFRYDAFVVYSDEDSDWVTENLLPRLNNNTQRGFSLCIRDRDWQSGADIFQSLTESITLSRKCLVVVSNSFVTSNWCKYGMALAQCRGIQEDRATTVLVFLEEMAPINVTPRLCLQMQHQTYIEWTKSEVGQRLFWKRLRIALEKPEQSIVHGPPEWSEIMELIGERESHQTLAV